MDTHIWNNEQPNSQYFPTEGDGEKMPTLNVIKVGGAVVENEESLNDLLDQFSALSGAKILVHGGGRSATKIASSLGIESQMIGGRRVTDSKMLEVVTMVYGGLVNKRIVAGLQSRGINAIGLTGADMNIIRSHKRPLKKVTMDDGTEQMVDFGFVGDVDEVDGSTLVCLLHLPSGRQGGGQPIPVIAPLTHDGNGNILNTNADTIAATVAKALTPFFDVTLTYCFEKPGVLRDADDDASVIHNINRDVYARLKSQGIVSGGMIPKLDNAFDSIASGVSRVIITSFQDISGVQGTTLEK